MWIKKPPAELNTSLYSEVKDRMYKLNFLYKEKNIYIMDNHLAAGYCWLDALDNSKSYNFFHIDQHEDLCSAGYQTMQCLRVNPNVTLDEYLNLLDFYGTNPLFSWDNYIHNIKDVYPEWFKECHFSCEYSITDSRPNGRELNITKNIDFIKNPNNKIFDDISKTSLKWIINIDVDYFWSNNEGVYEQTLTDNQISQFCDNLISALDNFSVITIALSPSCCGGWKNSYKIVKILTDKLNVNFSLAGIA